jgi:hypothetical protein
MACEEFSQVFHHWRVRNLARCFINGVCGTWSGVSSLTFAEFSQVFHQWRYHKPYAPSMDSDMCAGVKKEEIT